MLSVVRDRVFLGEPGPQAGRDLRGGLAGQILNRVEGLGLTRTLPPHGADEDVGRTLQVLKSLHVGVDVECSEVDHILEVHVHGGR